MKSYAFLFWAYNVFWLLLAGYVLRLVLRLARTERRLANLERELARRDGAGQASSPS